jgi:hypothetical protein
VKRLLSLAGLAAALASCSGQPVAVPTSTPLPATASPTTTVAFPTIIPTATWTPGPTQTPTAGLLPGLGIQLLHDSMDDASAWELPTTATGAAAITDGRLTLSIRAPRAYQTARRLEPIVGDFFAEIDMVTEVCSAGDELGLTARGGGKGEQYRFLVGCDGSARITRVLEEGSRALTLRVAPPVIHRGAPALNHLSIWLHDLDLKFLINGQEVLSVRDAALQHGTLGIIARAGTGGQVSAAFDDLRVYALTDPRRTPAAAATPAAWTATPGP